MKPFAKGLIYCVSRLLLGAVLIALGTLLIDQVYLRQAGVTSDDELSGADQNVAGWLMLLALLPEIVVGWMIGSRVGRWTIKKRLRYLARASHLTSPKSP